MNYTYTKSILALIVILGFSFHAESQNLYPVSPIYYGSFETNTVLWYSDPVTPKNGITISSSTDQALNGQRSAKVYAADCSIYTDKSQNSVSVILGGSTPDLQPGNVNNVAAGEYTFKIKIFIEDQAPSQVIVLFAESTAGITTGKLYYIPLKNVPVGSWQTIQTNVKFDGYTAMKTGVRVRHQDYAGLTGPSTIYFDNMELLSNTSAVSTVNESQIDVYSTKDLITITTPTVSNVDIYNMSGRIVKSVLGVNGKTQIATNNLQQGVYLASITSNNYNYTKKFLIQ